MGHIADLEYSNEALSVKGLFYDKTITVYVEGGDDVSFLGHLFDVAEVDAHIEPLGGREELEKYYDKIILENADFIIAMDNDNSEFMDNPIFHPNVIRTYGYSIENSMYFNKNSIVEHIGHYCRKRIDVSEEIERWINDFSNAVKDLIVYDIANNKYGKGKSVFGDNCCRMLKTKHSHEICSEKLSSEFEKMKDDFTDNEIATVKKMIEDCEKELWFLIKGHFITHSLINLMKMIVKREKRGKMLLNPDSLYSMTVKCSENWGNRIDIKTVVDKIKAVCS